MGFSTIDDPPPLSINITSDAAVCASSALPNRVRRVNGFGIGRGMSAAKIAKAAHLRGGLDRTGHDAFERRLADLLRQGLDHRVSGLADRDNQHARIRLQVVKIFADPQHSALTMHVPRKCPGNGSLGQRVTKDFAGGVAHLAKLRFAVGIGHW